MPHRYRSAARDLRKRFADDSRGQELEQIVIRSCDAARRYQAHGNDWFKKRRGALNMARNKRDTLRSAARKLADECRTGNLLLAVAIHPALKELGYVLSKNFPIVRDRHGHLTTEEQPPLHVLLGNLLAAIARRLDGADIETLADPDHLRARRRHGNMEFTKEIGRSHLPGVDTMLAFQLEFYMRAFVAGRPFAPHPFDTPTGNALHGKPHRDLAATMKDGKPHRDLIASFVTAAFPKSALTSARAIEDRMKSLTPRVLWLDDFR